MRNYFLISILFFWTPFATAQSAKDNAQIYAILSRQMADWNKGDIASFMHGYWKSDSLLFVGKSGVTYGYKQTYSNYLKRYPDRSSMGTLTFDFIRLTFPGRNTALLVGKFHLKRLKKGDVEGYFTLTWKKVHGEWVIVCDHTSS